MRRLNRGQTKNRTRLPFEKLRPGFPVYENQSFFCALKVNPRTPEESRL